MGSYKLVEDSILLSTLSQQVISHGKPRKPMFKKVSFYFIDFDIGHIGLIDLMKILIIENKVKVYSKSRR